MDIKEHSYFGCLNKKTIRFIIAQTKETLIISAQFHTSWYFHLFMYDNNTEYEATTAAHSKKII